MKFFHVFISIVLIAGFSCKKADREGHNETIGQEGHALMEEPLEHPKDGIVDESISEDNGISIFRNVPGETAIKYISWENVVKFIDHETIALSTYDRMTGDGAEYIGTYSLEINDNVAFLDVHLDNGENDRWLILANGALCSIIKSDGKSIFAVTGSVNRTECFSFFVNTVRATSYLEENGVEYLPENLRKYDMADKPWVEGVDGQGIGEKIFFKDFSLNNGSMHISIGYVSYDKPYLYTQNSRPKTISLSVENKFSITVSLKDTPNFQEIKLPSDISNDDTLILEILDVYPGTKFEDTCINSILFEMYSGFYKDNDYWNDYW